MSDAPVSVSSSSGRQSTKEKLEDLQNMSPKEVRDYLSSDEFQTHGSKALTTNAKRVATIMTGNAKQLSLEDSSLLRTAISAIERAKYASGHEVDEMLTKARAYGYDAEKDSDGKGGTDMGTPAPGDALAAQPDGSVDDDEDVESSGDEEDETDDDDE